MSWSADGLAQGRCCSSILSTGRCCATRRPNNAPPRGTTTRSSPTVRSSRWRGITSTSSRSRISPVSMRCTDGSLREALLRLCREAEAAPGVVALSDRRSVWHRLPVPMALAVGAVHSHLLATGRRMATDIVAIAGDAVDVHDVACLITIGATAVHPYLAFATVGDEAAPRYRKALETGLLKVMAKMGISCATSYRAAEVP